MESEPNTREISELLLTPLLGVVGLGLYTLHNELSLWHSLEGKLVPAILMAVPILALTSIAAHRLKVTELPLLARFLAASAFSGLCVGACYFVAASQYYDFFSTELPSDPESRGDIVAIWKGEAIAAGIVAAIATALSDVLGEFASGLLKRT